MTAAGPELRPEGAAPRAVVRGGARGIAGSCGPGVLLWAALILALLQLLLQVLMERLGAGGAGALLGYLRAALACLVLPVAGLPPALALLGRFGQRSPGAAGTGAPRREIGAFALVAVSIGCALVLHFMLAVGIRALAPPVTGYHHTLLALGIAAAGLLLGARFERLNARVRPEPGLTRWPLLLALGAALAVAAVGQPRLFGGLERFIPLADRDLAALQESGLWPPDGPPEVLSGARRIDARSWRAVAAEVTFLLVNSGAAPRAAQLTMVLSASPGSAATLLQLPNDHCRIAQPRRGQQAQEPRSLGITTVPEDVYSIPTLPVLKRFNGLLRQAVDLQPGPNCFMLRLTAPDGVLRDDVVITDVSNQDLDAPTLLGGQLAVVQEGAVECHLSDASYRLEMRERNVISPQMLLWGYFLQFVVEQLSGGRDPAMGVLYLFLSLLCFCAALVMIGAGAETGDEATDPAVQRRWLVVAGLLALGPLVAQLQSMVAVPSRSYAFPDMSYSFLLLSALALLARRQLVGFILLGCLAAFARYPGAYVLAVALFARLFYFRQERAWTRRAILLSLGAGLVVAALLLLYFGLTIGLPAFFKAIYAEVFPEHFEVLKHAAPVWMRIGIFFTKLGLLCGLTMLAWPLARDAASKTLIMITLATAATMMAVHIPHTHYFPPLIYCAAAAGLGALRRRRSPTLTWAMAALIILAVWISFGFDPANLSLAAAGPVE